MESEYYKASCDTCYDDYDTEDMKWLGDEAAWLCLNCSDGLIEMPDSTPFNEMEFDTDSTNDTD